MSFKGILKYLIYLFIAGWMFLLGIMVGRGSAPVQFDTQKFQKRLEVIAREFGKKNEPREKIDLKFYDVLDYPVPEEESSSEKKSTEIFPQKEKVAVNDIVPLKTSRKKLTFHKKKYNKAVDNTKENRPKVDIKIKPARVRTKNISPKKNKVSGQSDKRKITGKYTIQIAAYKDFKDAVTQMAALEKKGYASYRVKGEKDGITWYRVRAGSFLNYDEARKFKEKLKKARINSMIVKRKNDDISK